MSNSSIQLVFIIFLSLTILSCRDAESVNFNPEDSLELIACENLISNCEILEDSLSATESKVWNDVFFLDWDLGFTVENSGRFSKTTDGGITWSLMDTGTDYNFKSIYFLNDQIGFLGGLKQWDGNGSIFLSTADGGQTWNTKLFKDTVGFDNLHFFDQMNGVARLRYVDSYLKYALSATDDGGLTWKHLDIPFLTGSFPVFVTDSRIYIMGDDQQVYMSEDKGDQWTVVSIPSSIQYGIDQMYFVNDLFGFISADKKLYRTIDGGLTWEETSLTLENAGGVRLQIQAMHFFDDSEGFIIHHVYEWEYSTEVLVEFPTYKGMKVLGTTDGGRTWNHTELIEDCHLNVKLQKLDQNNLISFGRGVNYQIRRE